jgi:hypothetical protein
MIFLSQLASDNFSRPNESPLQSPPWAVDSFGDVGLQIISSGVCELSSSGGLNVELYTGQVLPNDQYGSFTVATITGSAEYICSVRLTDNGAAGMSLPAYTLRVVKTGGVTWSIFRASVQIASGSGLTLNIGDVFVLAVVGTTLFALQNGSQFGTVTNTTFTSGISAQMMFPQSGSLSAAQISNFACGAASTTPPGHSISGNAGVAGATVSWSGTASGSTVADGSGNYTIPSLADGPYTITPSLTGYTFSPPSQAVVVSGSNVVGINFTATSTAHYSVPDARSYGNFPNTAVNVNGTLTYTGQSSSLRWWFNTLFQRVFGTPADSRSSGITVASGSYPQNSRAPGVFGPGE